MALCMLVSVFAVSSSAADTALTSMEKSILKLKNADADSNGTISTADAKLLLRAAAGIEAEKDSYDVDLDGATSISDALAVLKESAGVKPLLTTAEALELFNNRINLVKSRAKQEDGETPVAGALPGFDKTTTMHCKSMLITTSGAPLSKLNVTNMEYNKYVDTIVDVMSSPLFAAAMDAEMKAQLEEMKVSAVEAYKPKSQGDTAETGDDVDHTTLFPIANIQDASRLTVSDVAAVTCTLSDNHLFYTVTMKNYTYTGNAYPTGPSGFQGRLNLPYGKAFNIMSLDESDGSTLNSVTYQNGKITLLENAQTGKLVEAHYSYTYKSDISAPQQDDLKMKTVMTSDVREDYIFY